MFLVKTKRDPGVFHTDSQQGAHSPPDSQPRDFSTPNVSYLTLARLEPRLLRSAHISLAGRILRQAGSFTPD